MDLVIPRCKSRSNKREIFFLVVVSLSSTPNPCSAMASKLIERASLGLFRRSFQQIYPSSYSSSSSSRSSCEGLSLFRRKFSTQQNPTDSPSSSSSSSPSFEAIPRSQKERIYNRVWWVGIASNFALAGYILLQSEKKDKSDKKDKTEKKEKGTASVREGPLSRFTFPEGPLSRFTSVPSGSSNQPLYVHMDVHIHNEPGKERKMDEDDIFSKNHMDVHIRTEPLKGKRMD